MEPEDDYVSSSINAVKSTLNTVAGYLNSGLMLFRSDSQKSSDDLINSNETAPLEQILTQ